MKPHRITDGLHAISLGGVNVFAIKAHDGLALIDAGFPGKATAILAALGAVPGDLRHIVLTHAHHDHVGSLAALVAATGAQTWMHPLDAPIVERGHGFRPLHPAPEWPMRLLHRIYFRPDGTVDPARIDHRISDGQMLPIAGGIEVLHVPGHCAGQVALLWRDHVLFAADACTNLFGLNSPIGYEDLEEGRRSQRRLAARNFEIACFGHGAAITRDAARRFRRKWGRD